jgi:hypothetical protein
MAPEISARLWRLAVAEVADLGRSLMESGAGGGDQLPKKALAKSSASAFDSTKRTTFRD